MRRIEANRQNAQRSTGPKTATGKARVAQNAITHGLLSEMALLPDEDPQALEALAEAMRAAWKPEGAQEELLVDWMIQALWRLRRLGHVEAGIFSWKQSSIIADRANRLAGTYERRALTAFSEAPEPPEITDPEKHQQAVQDAEQMRARRNQPTATIGLSFVRAASAFTTLSRYEAAIHRSYYRALHTLQRLQHARLGGHVPPPLTLDVTVSGQDDGGADVQSGSLDGDGRENRDPRQERETNRVEEHTWQGPAEPDRGLDDWFCETKP